MATTAATGTTNDVAAPGGVRHGATSTRGALGPLAIVAVCALAAVALRGGFSNGSRLAFAGLAAFALAVALWSDEGRVVAFLKARAVVVLLALGALAVLSAAWTVGDGAAAVRWGLVIAGYGAIAATTAAGSRDQRALFVVAGVIAGLAAVEAVLGLVAAGLRVEPMAERIEGSWRPGGTFEYPPALALLQVAALPVLLRGMGVARSRWLGTAVALGTALAGAVVALSAGRLEIAMALLVAATAVARPAWAVGPGPLGGSSEGSGGEVGSGSEAGSGSGRRFALGAVLVAVASAVGARLVAGGYAYPGATGGDAGRLLGLAAVVVLPALAWAPLRTRLTHPAGPQAQRTSLNPAHSTDSGTFVVVGAVVVLAAVGVALAAGTTSGKFTEPSGGFSHGRTEQWRAAVDTVMDHPVAGAGADSYGIASIGHQTEPASLYAHNLPLETWAELGPLGLGLIVALYGLTTSLLWRLRRHPDAWLFAPGVAAFLLANLVDWPWHLAGSGAVWALGLGACLALHATVDEKATNVVAKSSIVGDQTTAAGSSS